jgi:hypothetical protein
MKTSLIVILILGGLAAGCGLDRTTAPKPHEASWNLVRFHETTSAVEGSYKDLFVRSDGAITLDDGRGDAVSAVGLLAGEKLETLARLIDALPPQSYLPPTPCTTDGFFVSVARDGAVTTYASGLCDPATPASLSNVSTLMQELLAEVTSPRTQFVPFTILLQGTASAVTLPRREVIQDRDALMRILSTHRPDQPVAVPQVDFKRQMVVAEFLGTREGDGYGVTVASAGKTEDGWLRIGFVRTEPNLACVSSSAATQPFVLVALERRSGGILYETTTAVTPCP